MIRSLPIAKVLVSLLNRRAYGAASSSGVWESSREKSGSSSQDIGAKVEEKAPENIEEKSAMPASWAPDPVTGFYKPCDSLVETNPAELRHVVLNHHKVKPHN